MARTFLWSGRSEDKPKQSIKESNQIGLGQYFLWRGRSDDKHKQSIKESNPIGLRQYFLWRGRSEDKPKQSINESNQIGLRQSKYLLGSANKRRSEPSKRLSTNNMRFLGDLSTKQCKLRVNEFKMEVGCLDTRSLKMNHQNMLLNSVEH